MMAEDETYKFREDGKKSTEGLYKKFSRKQKPYKVSDEKDVFKRDHPSSVEVTYRRRRTIDSATRAEFLQATRENRCEQSSEASTKENSDEKQVLAPRSVLGTWERHTRGIGAKLLAKMGFKPGKGLGKKLQGICEPIQVTKYTGRGTIGMPSLTLENKGHIVRDLIEPVSSRKRCKRSYMSAEELLKDSEYIGVQEKRRDLRMKVIDMTGREKRVLWGLNALNYKVHLETDSMGLHLRNLSYNADITVEICEQEIIANAREILFQNDQISAIQELMRKLEMDISKETTTLKILTSIVNVLEIIEEERNKSLLDLDCLLKVIRPVEKSHPEEFLDFDLCNLALVYLIPSMKQQLLVFWRPFDSTSSNETCISYFRHWRPLLESRYQTTHRSGNFGVVMNPFHRVIWDAWVPAFQEIVSNWDHKYPDGMVNLLDSWETLLPVWIMKHILAKLILPKLEMGITAWDPSTDLIPIHQWIHPWFPRFGSKLDILHHSVQWKMGQALETWNPSDQSARLMLIPWILVFSKDSMKAFLLRNIFPKLQAYLLNWEINPNHQDLGPWFVVLEWKDVISNSLLVQLLLSSFFPKWLKVLVDWLAKHPDFNEVVGWYTGWKRLLPSDVVNHHAIEERLREALSLMHLTSSNYGR